MNCNMVKNITRFFFGGGGGEGYGGEMIHLTKSCSSFMYI